MHPLKKAIEAASDLTPVPLKLEGWPEGIFLRKITGGELDKHYKVIGYEDDGPEETGTWIRKAAVWAAVCMVDENGQSIFDPEKEEDISILMSKSFTGLSALNSKINKLNGLDKDTEDDAKKN